MDVFAALLLGLIQGLTEFLPVSSTGHLILARDVLGITAENGLAFDVVLHLATLLAVLWYFRSDIAALGNSLIRFSMGRSVEPAQKSLLLALVLGSLPAGIIGILFQDAIEGALRSATAVAWVLILGSILFVIAEWVGRQYEEKRSITLPSGIMIGFFQALALLPGMSRSGATISGGLLLGLSRENAARYSFLLSIPVILGAGILKLAELADSGVLFMNATPIFIGAIAAFSAGLLAIHFLMQFVRRHSLIPFVVYRLVLAVVILALA
jgi:undecaprenyl-diphosphatase